MHQIKWKILFLVLFPLSLLAKTEVPKISVSFPENFYSNEEIEVFVSFSNLKENFYDLKISIEREKTLSEIFNPELEIWKDSYYYLKKAFSGPRFEGKFKLRLKKEFSIFEGKAEIIVKIRESEKTKTTEYRGKINILKPEIKKEETYEKETLASFSDSLKEKNYATSTFLIAISAAIFSAVMILILKLKLKKIKQTLKN